MKCKNCGQKLAARAKFCGSCGTPSLGDSEIEQDDAPIERKDTRPYYSLSLPKLFIMSICTFGFYRVYWFYKNWTLKQSRDHSDVDPFWRAVFGPLFLYPLLQDMLSAERRLGREKSFSAGAMATAFIVSGIFAFLPKPYSRVVFLPELLILPIQALANQVNYANDPAGIVDGRIRGWNWAVVILGGGMLALALSGILFGDAS
jgi:hypothetical protein